MMNLPNELFVDTSFLLALAHNKDAHHTTALSLQAELSRQKIRKITSEYVLFELGNGLSRIRFRSLAKEIIEFIRHDQTFEIVPASTELFEQALQLFSSRIDKEWGLTDCSSFVIMQQRNLSFVLTADHHFEQAGFQILLRAQKK